MSGKLRSDFLNKNFNGVKFHRMVNNFMGVIYSYNKLSQLVSRKHSIHTEVHFVTNVIYTRNFK
jgi:hypothetical protein